MAGGGEGQGYFRQFAMPCMQMGCRRPAVAALAVGAQHLIDDVFTLPAPAGAGGQRQ